MRCSGTGTERHDNVQSQPPQLVHGLRPYDAEQNGGGSLSQDSDSACDTGTGGNRVPLGYEHSQGGGTDECQCDSAGSSTTKSATAHYSSCASRRTGWNRCPCSESKNRQRRQNGQRAHQRKEPIARSGQGERRTSRSLCWFHLITLVLLTAGAVCVTGNDCFYKQMGITAAWGKCWLSQSQSYMCVIMGILMQCMPSLICVNKGACTAAGATLPTGCMDSLILALSIACVLVLALAAILLPTGKAQDDSLSPAQQQRQRSIYRAAAERYRRQWHARRNRRSLLDKMQPAAAAPENNATGHSSTLGPSKWNFTALFLLYLLLWPSAASLHAMASSALDRSVAMSVSIQHTAEACESLAQSHHSMCPQCTLMSLAPEDTRSCLPNCSMPLHVLSASYTSLGWQNAPSQQEHLLVLRALRQRWADVPETLFILPCWQIERDLSAQVEHSCLCVDLLLDINVNPRLHALLESIHSALVAIPDNRGLVLLGRTGHGSSVAMAAYTTWLMTSLSKPAILRHLHRDEWPCSSACIECGR